MKLNESINLDPIRIELFDSNKKEIGKTDGIIEISFFPKYQILIKGEISGVASSNFKGLLNLKYIKIDSREEFISVIPLNIKLSGTATFTLLPTKSSVFIGSKIKVFKAKFYITNFDPVLKKKVLEIGKWKLDLNFISELEEFEKLKKIGGYLITHEGTISLKNGDSFRIQDIKELLEYLLLYFTFINGFETRPIYIRGIDKKDKIGCYQVSNDKIDRFQKTKNWCEILQTDIESFNKGFYSLFNQELYKQYLGEIIYWYVQSNRDGSDKSVILSHTCLELISWVHLTLEKQNLSKEGFNKLSAADALSLTLSSCSIPIEVPKKLQALTKLAKNDNIDNSCQIFSLVRNKIIHPSSKRRSEITKSEHVIEAKLLGCQFIELFILRKSEYQGSYFNRVNHDAWRGEVETVPWVISDQ